MREANLWPSNKMVHKWIKLMKYKEDIERNVFLISDYIKLLWDELNVQFLWQHENHVIHVMISVFI
jgi:hypothetical protein